MVNARRGFTLIELVFAIVIMGIIFLSLPYILVNNARNLEQNLLQEAILVTATKMGQITTYQWDENSTVAGQILDTADVLTVTAGDAELDRNVSDFRRGHFQEALHRRMTPAIADRTASTTMGFDTGDGNIFDDIDDFNGQNEGVARIAGGVGYKNDYNMTITVGYVSDSANYTNGNNTPVTLNLPNAPAGGMSNIKLISVDTASNGTPAIVLFSYVSNIGETDYYKRTY